MLSAVGAARQNGYGFGPLLRQWRLARRLSQEALALAGNVSPRHMSFLETGRSRPSREMVLGLAEQLDLPLRDRNELLLAAGFAPAYLARPDDDPQLRVVNETLRGLLAAHDPYPAAVVDSGWNRLIANEGSRILLAGVAPALLTEPVNIMRLTLHPEGMAPRIRNLGEWSQHLLHRLRRQAIGANSAELAALREELAGYPGVEDRPVVVDDPGRRIALPLEYESEHGTLRFLSVTASFGAPSDITLAGMIIEYLYPADDATRDILTGRARTG
ncbi:helix-turn-helix transcriptional regulator [Rugosimonospora acidiphila]|uniref:Helix-turn-helix transcriptional regulator n=1 Tax=Rugosimonospora acidiphila TaxID=556531 RepID=A0ABP9SHL5_9ACTN